MDERIAYYLLLVEEALYRLGVQPKTARQEQPGHWVLKRGSAEVVAAVRPGPDNKGLFLTLASPMLELKGDLNQPTLFSHLLQLNRQLVGASFSLTENTILLTACYDLLVATPDQLARSLDAITFFADKLDDELKQQFPLDDRPPMGFARTLSQQEPRVPTPDPGTSPTPITATQDQAAQAAPTSTDSNLGGWSSSYSL
jgi:hypothetical protein